MREVGPYAFLDCSGLVSAEFCEGVEKAGFNAFWCAGLISVALPDSLREIPSTFDNALGLREVRLSCGQMRVAAQFQNDFMTP